MMQDTMLEVRSLEVAIRRRKVITDVSFAIGRGETLALIGESGSGKSMTASAIMGLLPAGLIMAGHSQVLLAGEPLPLGDEARMRQIRGRRIGMIFQDPMSCLNPYMSVGKQVDESLRRLGIGSAAERHARIVELFRLVELPTPEKLVRRYPHQLSGGQQQRVMIAMALAAEPEVLIADEPTSALDATVQAEILNLLQRMQERFGMAILFITHDLAAAARIASQVVVMQLGKVVEQGAVARVMAAPEQDYTRLLVSVRRILETPPECPGERGAESNLLAVKNIEYAYPARSILERPVPALSDISLKLEASRTLGVLGESGSGKSTLAALIAGLAAPAGGDIELFGQSMRARHFRMSRTIRRRCQIVFQNPFGALNPRLTIEKAMREPIEMLEPDAARTIRPRLEEALGWVGLDAQYLERYPHQLSGGQRQRVCIARSLLSRPDLLICDEVVSALDASVQMQVLQTLKSLQEKLGFAMLFIGHDIQIVRWISDTIVVMNRGRIVEQGASSQILTAPRDAYTQRLIAAMPTPLEMASASV